MSLDEKLYKYEIMNDNNLISSYTSSPSDLTPGQKMISACIGAIVTSFLVTPFDVIKTRLQSQNSTLQSSYEPIRLCCRELFFSVSCSPTNKPNFHPIRQGILQCSYINSNTQTLFRDQYLKPLSTESSSIRFNGLFDGVIQITRNEGLSSLWRGLSPTLIMAIPAQVVYLTGYDLLRERIHQQFINNSYDKYTPLLAGAIARTFAATLISPIELFRTRLQSQSHSSISSTSKDILNMVQKQGIQTLWRGIGPTLARDVPFSAYYWFGYERIKFYLRPFFLTRQQNEILNFHSINISDIQLSFTSGAISGMIAAFLTHPFDTAKTHSQVNKEILSMHKLIMQIFKLQGYRGIFRGLVPRIFKVAPSCAVAISTFEAGKMFFASKNLQKKIST